MTKESAGLLLFREVAGSLEVLLVHPGGPFWAKKDEGAWSIPKGEFEPGEDPLATARREFEEETGLSPSGELIPLVPLRQPSGKLVHAWAVRGDFEPSSLRSNTFSMEWPPRSGKRREFPEVDRAAWFSIEEATRKMLKGQVRFLSDLREKLGNRGAVGRSSARLGVRPMRIEDVPAVVRYWTGASRADLDRMGVDIARLPGADELTRSLSAVCHEPVREARAAYLVWEVDGVPIGHAGLKNIRYGDSGDMHLHIWDAAARGRGHGARLFALSALDFYERFGLTRIVCEPKADNPMPNRMLQKSGYALLESRVGASSELSTICRLNVYSIDRETAARIAAT